MPLMIINNYLRTIKRWSQMIVAQRKAEKKSFYTRDMHASWTFDVCLPEGIEFSTRKKHQMNFLSKSTSDTFFNTAQHSLEIGPHTVLQARLSHLYFAEIYTFFPRIILSFHSEKRELITVIKGNYNMPIGNQKNQCTTTNSITHQLTF